MFGYGFVREKSAFAVERVHRSIIETYIDDFSKYKKRVNTEHLSLVFNYTTLDAIENHLLEVLQPKNIVHVILLPAMHFP